MKHSTNRVHYLNHVFSFPPNKVPNIVVSPFMGDGYIISFLIGTPPFQLYGVMDTANDNIWFQCNPCKPCFNTTSPMFDPSKSSTYKTIPCSSPKCKNVENTHCSSDDKKVCEYSFTYGGEAYSQGDLSIDTLTLNSNNDTPISFKNIVIGCGHRNKGPLEGYVSGNIGLGRGPLSFISQLNSSIGGKFSYCLVPLFSNEGISGKLHFGDKSVVSGVGTVSTPITAGEIGYSTTLNALSVGDHIIKFENSTSKNDNLGNTIIDSGTTLTILPENVYSRLESIVTSMVKLERAKSPNQQFKLCYKATLKNLDVPIITAHFNGADVHLNSLNTFYPIDHEVVCFAFVSVGNFPGTIIGNIAQQNFLVGFDLQKNIISFKPTDCTKS
ncbi:aspartic proteinase CDR1 [Medicago truncatula]|nr:aspartic proteinase CDR1 [Medicago truncatula]